MRTRCVFCRSFGLPILHSGHWFAAPLLSAHHMLGQWTGTSVDERFGTLIWLINAYASCHMTYERIRLVPYFYHAEYTNLVWSIYILLAILGRKISGFGTPLLLVQYNIDRPEERTIRTIFISGNEITQKMCSCSLIRAMFKSWNRECGSREFGNGERGTKKSGTGKPGSGKPEMGNRKTRNGKTSPGSWFTSSSRVLPTSRVVKPIENAVYCLNHWLHNKLTQIWYPWQPS